MNKNINDLAITLAACQTTLCKMAESYESALTYFACQTAAIEKTMQHISPIDEKVTSSLLAIENAFSKYDFSALTNSAPYLEKLVDLAIPDSLSAILPALDTLSTHIRDINYKEKIVSTPEQSVPGEPLPNTETECIIPQSQDDTNLPIVSPKSPLEICNCIISIIASLLAIIGFIQTQLDPTAQQMQELIEEQSNANGLLERNNELLQQQLDTTTYAVECLSSILSEIQTFTDDVQEECPHSQEHSECADSDSQSTDPSPSEIRPECGMFLDESDNHDTN